MNLAATKKPRDPDGMTLIELLTVVFLGSLLLTMVFILYTNTSRTYIRQEAVMEQMLNLRGGLSGISRQIRMAGNGFALLGLNQNQHLQIYLKNPDGVPSGWFKYPAAADFGARAIWAVDGGNTGPDVVTVCALGPDFASALGILAADFHASDDRLELEATITIPAGLDESEVLKAGDFLAVVPVSGDPVLVEADSDGSDLTRIRIKDTPGHFPNGVSSLPAGSSVYNVKTVMLRTFSVDPVNHDLVMDSNEVVGDVMAENIEDLQLEYCLAPDDPADPLVYVNDLVGQDLLHNPVQTVHLIMVSRSPTTDPFRGKHAALPALNHTAVGAADSFIRRFLENTVQLRNY
jgi:prepilin-type N-terminal cleavage/methylation domain-containing protein